MNQIIHVSNIYPVNVMSLYIISPSLAYKTTPTPQFNVTTAISSIISFIVALVIGIFIGLLVMYSCMRKKAVYSPTVEGQANIGPTAPVDPVYEEVSLKEEIELNTNKAYGPIGL